ncbi:MAG: 1-acyl-sn-glycerol-3-phosphate acyltransferase [Bacteroidales bacterium]|nr:1-acyl-sn-glycerol-3-phosphate acyltransferase [Bacteroidales bacterium]
MFLSKLILKLAGWTSTGTLPVEKKCIVIAAPHTSNWDFVLGWLYYKSLGGSIKVMIKEDIFFFPLGILLRWMGAIPVDRRPGNRMIEKMGQEFAKSDILHLAIAPEGTRGKVTEWKKGFLLIARRADVPVYLAYADYKKKQLGMLGKFIPTDDTNADIRAVQKSYEGITPCHPTNFAT